MMPDPQNDLTPEEDRAFAEQEAVAKRAARWAVTADDTTRHSSPLSDEQTKFLARMKRAREHGDMPSMHDTDILIAIIEELTRA